MFVGQASDVDGPARFDETSKELAREIIIASSSMCVLWPTRKRISKVDSKKKVSMRKLSRFLIDHNTDTFRTHTKPYLTDLSLFFACYNLLDEFLKSFFFVYQHHSHIEGLLDRGYLGNL